LVCTTERTKTSFLFRVGKRALGGKAHALKNRLVFLKQKEDKKVLKSGDCPKKARHGGVL